MESFAVLFLLSIAGHVLGGSCPQAGHLPSACTCAGDKVRCYDYDNGIDLDQVFEILAQGHNPGDQLFEWFELSSNTLETLPADVFRGVTFRELKFIDCDKLGCIDTRAFTGNEKITTSVIAENSNLNLTTKDCNIFTAMSSLTNLQSVKITGSKLKEVPANAFSGRGGAQNSLLSIDLSGGQGGSITTIGHGAFSHLKFVNKIDLSYHKILKIEKNAFQFIENNENSLTINLERNWDAKSRQGLNGESFIGSVFMVGNRITTLKLGRNPGLKYLKEETFSPYLINKANPNKIDMTGTTLGYYYQNEWLIENMVAMNLMDKISNVETDDGQSIWSVAKSWWTATPPATTVGTTPGTATTQGSPVTSTVTTARTTGSPVTSKVTTSRTTSSPVTSTVTTARTTGPPVTASTSTSP